MERRPALAVSQTSLGILQHRRRDSLPVCRKASWETGLGEIFLGGQKRNLAEEIFQAGSNSKRLHNLRMSPAPFYPNKNTLLSLIHALLIDSRKTWWIRLTRLSLVPGSGAGKLSTTTGTLTHSSRDKRYITTFVPSLPTTNTVHIQQMEFTND